MNVIPFTDPGDDEMSPHDDDPVWRHRPRYREAEDTPDLRRLVGQVSAQFHDHMAQEDRDRKDIKDTIRGMSDRLQKIEVSIITDEARANFAKAIGEIIIKVTTLVAVVIGAVIAFWRFKAGG